jgi:hypothetical protein
MVRSSAPTNERASYLTIVYLMHVSHGELRKIIFNISIDVHVEIVLHFLQPDILDSWVAEPGP